MYSNYIWNSANHFSCKVVGLRIWNLQSELWLGGRCGPMIQALSWPMIREGAALQKRARQLQQTKSRNIKWCNVKDLHYKLTISELSVWWMQFQSFNGYVTPAPLFLLLDLPINLSVYFLVLYMYGSISLHHCLSHTDMHSLSLSLSHSLTHSHSHSHSLSLSLSVSLSLSLSLSLSRSISLNLFSCLSLVFCLCSSLVL